MIWRSQWNLWFSILCNLDHVKGWISARQISFLRIYVFAMHKRTIFNIFSPFRQIKLVTNRFWKVPLAQIFDKNGLYVCKGKTLNSVKTIHSQLFRNKIGLLEPLFAEIERERDNFQLNLQSDLVEPLERYVFPFQLFRS